VARSIAWREQPHEHAPEAGRHHTAHAHEGQPLSWFPMGDGTFVLSPVMCGPRYDESTDSRFPGGVAARTSRRMRLKILM
jgi:hypothetical protein